jgi:CheY-specific phosphatase CheX
VNTAHTEPCLAPIVAKAVHHVLNTQFHLPAEALAEPPAAPAGYASKLQSRIDLSGARVRGEIILSLPDALANLLVAHMLGLPDTTTASDADKLDLAGEFCNMLSGQIGGALTASGYLNDLSTPKVQRLEADASEGTHVDPDFAGAWSCAGLPFTLSLSLRFEPT